MDYLLDRTQKRIGLIGLASGAGSNEHSTASSRQRWMSNLYISSFSIKAVIKKGKKTSSSLQVNFTLCSRGMNAMTYNTIKH
jgi:hypothetical protein